MGLCSHTVLPCRRRGRVASVGSHHGRLRDHQSSTCVICILSDTLDGRHVAKRGGMDLHRTVVTFHNRGTTRSSNFSSDDRDRWQPWRRVEPSGAPDPHLTDSVAIAIVFHRTADAPRNPSPRDRAIVAIRSPEAPSDGADKMWKNPRSRSDRAAIAPRSRCDRAAIAVLSLGNHLQSIGRRSMKDHDHDHGPIAARSWRDHGSIVAEIAAIWKPN